MTPTNVPPTSGADQSDPELITLVRSGDVAAYERLFARHRETAFRFAVRLAGPERAEDICSEAFTRILDLLQRGKGPDVAFRAYLLTTVRTVHLNAIRAGCREGTLTDTELQCLSGPVLEDVEARFDQSAIARAFRQLPERWQSALWMTAVEGLPHEEVSRHLGIQANAVTSLTFRARAGLRQAYLAEHLRGTADAECRRILEHLPSFLRGTLSPRRRRLVEAHLDRCSRCSVAADELADVDRRLGALLAPLVVGAGAAASLWPTAASVPGVPTGAGVVGSVSSAVGIAKVVVAASVTAACLGAGVHSLRADDPSRLDAARVPAEFSDESARPAGRRPGVPTTSTPVRAVSPTPIRTVAPAPASARAPVLPPVPTPTSSPPPSPTPDPTPTPMAAAPAPGTGVGPLSSETVPSELVRWRRVTVPVTNAVEGSKLRITSTETLAFEPVPTLHGWVCVGAHAGFIGDPAPLPGSTTDCVYGGDGDGSPFQIDYLIPGTSWVRAVLTAPAGFVDDDPLDNVAELFLEAEPVTEPGVTVD